MKKVIFILSLLLIAVSLFAQENRIKPEKNIEQAPAANYIMLSDVSGNFQIVPSNTLPGGGGGDIIQSVTYNGDVVSITTDQGVFNININANTVETTAPISINGNVYPAGTDIQTLLGVVGVAINNISLVDNGDGTYTFTDTDGNTVTINTGGGVSQAAFYKKVLFNESYSLPYDTINKYDLLTISVQTGGPFNQVITLPDLPDSINNGKIIVLNFDSGSEIIDDVVVQGTGNSVLIQSNCYQEGRTEQADTFSINYDNPLTVIYHTAYFDDYYRQCELLVTEAEIAQQIRDSSLAVKDQFLTNETRWISFDGGFVGNRLFMGYTDNKTYSDDNYIVTDYITGQLLGAGVNAMIWNTTSAFTSVQTKPTGAQLLYQNVDYINNTGSNEQRNLVMANSFGSSLSSRVIEGVSHTTEGNTILRATDSLAMGVDGYQFLGVNAEDSLISLYMGSYDLPKDKPVASGKSIMTWVDGVAGMEEVGNITGHTAFNSVIATASVVAEKNQTTQIDSAGGAITYTVDPADLKQGESLYLTTINGDINTITIDAPGGVTFLDGTISATISINSAREDFKLVFDGVNIFWVLR